MKSLLPLPLITLLALLLSGCPDANIPRPPPKIPLPKAAASAPQSQADIAPHDRIFYLTAA
jgi:hypothetical protein